MATVNQSHLKVMTLSNKGLGIVKIEGKTYFVDGTYAEDEITVAFDAHLPSHSEIELVSVDVPSPKRVHPTCPHFSVCRGCTLMGLEYNEQLRLKREKLIHQFLKNKIDPRNIGPIIPSPSTLNYRNRGQFKINGQVVGYADKWGKNIIPINSCQILSKKNQTFLAELLASLPDEKFSPGEGFSWNYIDFDESTCLSTVKLNTRLPFAQGNSEVNILMKEWLSDQLSKFATDHKIVEFFCGSGNFTEVLARSNASEVIAIEVQGVALNELKKKEFSKVRIVEEDLFKSNVWKKIEPLIKDAKIWVLDPPRSGLNYQRAWIKSMPKLTDIFYISCDPESFTRDIAQFIKMGFKIQEISPIDQFPHTIHFEIMGHLQKEL